MEAKELRIGNFIQQPNSKVDRVEEIVCKELKGSKEYAITFESRKVGYYLNHEGRELIKGIEITEQWLLDLGFRRDSKTSYRYFIDDWLAYDLDDNCIRVSDSWEFGKRKYVHELQNLYFALTGKELELTHEPSTCG